MKNKLRNLIIIFCVLLIILIVAYILNPINTSSLRINKINNPNKMDANMNLPENLHYVIGAYDGFLTTENIAKNYNHFAEYAIPEYFNKCKNLNSEELKKYFEKNKNTIYIELAYSEFEEFEDFINTIKTLQGDSLVFESYRILDNSTSKVRNSLSAYLEVKYKDSGKVVFETIIPKALKDECSSIKLTSNVDDEVIKKDEESYSQREEVLKNNETPYTRGTPIE